MIFRNMNLVLLISELLVICSGCCESMVFPPDPTSVPGGQVAVGTSTSPAEPDPASSAEAELVGTWQTQLPDIGCGEVLTGTMILNSDKSGTFINLLSCSGSDPVTWSVIDTNQLMIETQFGGSRIIVYALEGATLTLFQAGVSDLTFARQ